MLPEQKLKNLENYVQTLQNRISAPVPPKHKIREADFRAFLKKDLKLTLAKIATLKTAV